MKTPYGPFLVALLAGCSSAPVIPGPSGNESLDQLEKATKSYSSACELGNDAAACQWISAFWRADSAAAVKACTEAGPGADGESGSGRNGGRTRDRFGKDCKKAAAYAVGCRTVRGYDDWTGDPTNSATRSLRDDPAFDKDNGRTSPGHCSFGSAYPPALVQAPPIEPDHALAYLATGCRRGDTGNCRILMDCLLSGLIAGIAIPQDFALARQVWERMMEIDHGKNWKETWGPPGAVEEAWQRDADGRPDESAEERDARIQHVLDVYEQSERQRGALLATLQASVDYRESHTTLSAIAAGLSAGSATNAAVDQNLSDMKSNVNATVAQSQAARRSARSQKPGGSSATAILSPGEPQTFEAKAKKDSKAQRQANLDACLSTDANCEYGTASACQPSVPYSDGAWTGRYAVKNQLDTFSLCSGNWSSECWPRLRAQLPDMKELGNRIDKLFRRQTREPGEVQNACPWPASEVNGEQVRQVTFWCSNLRKDCPAALQKAYTALDGARSVDECLYFAESQYARNQLKAKHDADCRQKYR